MANDKRAPVRRNIETIGDSAHENGRNTTAVRGDTARRAEADGASKSAGHGGRDIVESWDEAVLMRRDDEFGEVY